jgi:hypothetical protein
MFVERDTGSKRYFSVPLAQAVEIHRHATSRVSGLARTARGPVMSAHPGKVAIDGVTDVGGRRHFVLRLLQARQADWCGQPFMAEYDSRATWLNELQPAFGAREFFYEEDLARLEDASRPRLVAA